jgi:hypothetical protein
VDGVLVEDELPGRFLGVDLNQDEILGQEVLELRVVVKLLTQQFTAPSSVGGKIEEKGLVIGFGLGERLVQGPLEPHRILGERQRGDHKHHQEEKCFFHRRTIFSRPLDVNRADRRI